MRRPSAAVRLLYPPDGPPSARITGQPGTRETREHDMALFTDFHEDLKLPPEAIAQIKAPPSPPGTLSVIFTIAGLPDHAVEIIYAPVPAPGSLSLDCHRGPLRCSQQTRLGRQP
jgi:hypothetical protein